MKSSQSALSVLSVLSVYILLFSAIPQQAHAQDFSSDPDWKVSAYLWTMGIDGDIGIGPINAGIELSFSDIFGALNYGGAVVMRRDWGRNVLVADLSYFSLSPDDVTGPLAGKITTDLNLPLLQFYYGRKTMLDTGHVGWLVGARYIKMDLTLGLKPNLPSEPAFRRLVAPDLTDFIVGGFYNRSINENWMLNLQGDIGAGGSDTTWNAQLIFQRKLQSGNMISIGMRAMDIDFDDRLSSGELFVIDALMSGLMFGFTWD